MSKFSRSLLCGLVVAVASISSVTAAPISQLVSTGMVVSGSVDQRWRITQNAETPGQTTAYAVTQNQDTLFPFFLRLVNDAAGVGAE